MELNPPPPLSLSIGGRFGERGVRMIALCEDAAVLLELS